MQNADGGADSNESAPPYFQGVKRAWALLPTPQVFSKRTVRLRWGRCAEASDCPPCRNNHFAFWRFGVTCPGQNPILTQLMKYYRLQGNPAPGTSAGTFAETRQNRRPTSISIIYIYNALIANCAGKYELQ